MRVHQEGRRETGWEDSPQVSMPAQAFEYVEEQEHRHGAMTSLISITRMGEGERLVSRQLVGHIPCPLYVKAGEAEDGLYNLKMNLS